MIRTRSFTDSEIAWYLSGLDFPAYIEIFEDYTMTRLWTRYRLGKKGTKRPRGSYCYQGNCKHVYKFDDMEQASDRLAQFYNCKE